MPRIRRAVTSYLDESALPGVLASVKRILVLLLLFSLPLAAQSAGPEIPVSDPTYGLPHGFFTGSVVSASNGRGFLTVWSNAGNIFGNRVTLAGDLLEPTIFLAPGYSDFHVASAGGDYLVVSPSGARFVKEDGTAGPIFELDFGCEGTPSVLISTGTHYLAATTNCAGILDADARFLAPVPTARDWGTEIKGAADAGGFVIVSTQYSNNLPYPLVVRIDPQGDEVSRVPLTQIVAGPDAIGTNGRESLTVWNGPWGFRGARISHDGRLIDDDVLLSVMTGAPVVINSDGEDFVIVVDHADDVRAAVL